MRQRSTAQERIDLVESLGRQIDDTLEYLELGAQENDEGAIREAEQQLPPLIQRVRAAELSRMLSGPVDHSNAIVSVHPGSGGTEAKDWGDMLLRMYLRYCERKGFKTEIIDYQAGDEAGIDGASFIASSRWIRPASVSI